MTNKKRLKTLAPLKNDQTDIDRIMIQTVMIEEGIVPILDPSLDMRRALASLSPEDARKARRKFRKLWRKALKKEMADRKSAYSGITLGKGKKVPSKAERLRRKQAVLNKLWQECIHAMVEKAQDPRK